MDAPLSVTAWLGVGALSFACVGALFGGLAGALAWRHGQAAGTALGQAAGKAVARRAREELSPTFLGMVVGGVDGAAFLGVVGLGVAALAWATGASLRPTALLPLVGGMALLAGGAALFGTAGYVLVWTGTSGLMRILAVVVGLLYGCAAGVAVAVFVGGWRGTVPGAITGAVLGTVLGLLAGSGSGPRRDEQPPDRAE